MPATSADHNLLVGVLALQLDFVNRDDLVDAAQQAMRAPAPQPLLQALRGASLLADDECDLLEALVSKHLSRHNNDPLECLAHCDGAGQYRARLASVFDPNLTFASPSADDTVGHDPRGADPHATRLDDALATPPLTSGPRGRGDATIIAAGDATTELHLPSDKKNLTTPPLPSGSRGKSRGGMGSAAPAPLSMSPTQRYRIIRPFQKGGLGQVSLARDEELNREVALKEILPKHADSDEARVRFLVEAEITGSLEHPGVVPVYGLGQYADGRPFYAMRLIRGDNLQLAIEEYHRQPEARDRELKFRQLLGRFVDVCNAIEYAHNRCVLHRDLKPGNIMLGKYGETLVVDWGLAKAIDASGTPCDTVELPVRPASGASSTDTQLGRVVGTPAYMSPEQASGRIDMLGPATDIYSLGATLYHLLVGHAPFSFDDRDTLLGSVQIGRFEPPRAVRPDVPKPLESVCLKAMALRPADRYVSARDLADDVERYLADEPVHAHPELLIARIGRWARKHRGVVMTGGLGLSAIAASLGVGVLLLNAANERAQSHFERARQAIGDYYITVSEETLLDQPGMQPLRDKLLRQALNYYKQFLATEQVDGKLLDEVAQANFYAGRITESIESPAEAIPYYQEAVAISSKLVAQTPSDETRLAAQARTLNALGGSMQKLHRWEESQKFYEQAETVRRRLVEEHPENAEYVRTLANTIMNRGSIDTVVGETKRGVDRMQEAQQLRADHIEAGARDERLRADAGMGDFNLGLFHLNEDDVETAEKHLRLAIESFEQLRKASPDDLASQNRLAMCYRILGDLHAGDEDPAFAQSRYAAALELLTTLTIRNPQVAEYKHTLGAMQISVAELQLAHEKLAEALAAIEGGIAPLTDLLEENPDDLLYQRDLAVALRVRATIHAASDDFAAARPDARRAIEMLDALVAADPEDADFQEHLELAKQVEASLPPEAPTTPAPSGPPLDGEGSPSTGDPKSPERR